MGEWKLFLCGGWKDEKKGVSINNGIYTIYY